MPKADDLVTICVDSYERLHGSIPDPDKKNLETLARFFHNKGEFHTQFLARLVPWDRFEEGEPNLGHKALADFLLNRHVDFVLTTNYDILVEKGASQLQFRKFYASLSLADAQNREEHQPLIKLHGCSRRNRAQTLWFREQLEMPERYGPLKTCVEDMHQWLPGALYEKVLVIVGFWTDWAYLNDVLFTLLDYSGEGRDPSLVVLVDPSPEDGLVEKAPQLSEWIQDAGLRFVHLQVSGDEFLDELRHLAVRSFIRRLLAVADVDPPEDLDGKIYGVSTDDLYYVKRDLNQAPPSAVVREANPRNEMKFLGTALKDLLARGYTFKGPYVEAGGTRCRVIHGAGHSVHSLRIALGEARFNGDVPDYAICVGSVEDGGVPARLMNRGFRGPGAEDQEHTAWVTYEQFCEETGQ